MARFKLVGKVGQFGHIGVQTLVAIMIFIFRLLKELNKTEVT